MPYVRAPLRRRLAVLAGTLILSAASASSGSAAGPDGFIAPDGGEAWDKDPAPATNQVIVTFEPGTTDAEQDRIAADAGLTKVSDLPSIDGAVYVTSDTASDGDWVTQAATDPVDGVVSATPDVRVRRDLDPTGEPGWDLLWGQHNTGQPIIDSVGTANVDIDGLEALAITGGDPAVVVAVIDDGVDFSHPDLAARAWTNPGESGAGRETNGLDDDDNGYVDDINGWDFCNDDNSVHDLDADFHGTHVAGTIAASLDGQGVVGVAPSVQVMGLKFLDNGGDCGFLSMAIEAIAYAKSFGVVISNNSWGGRGDLGVFMPLYDAVADSGMLFVTSAGNDGIDNDEDPFPAYPASFDLPNIISVAATDNDGALAPFSNYGHVSVDIAAPGVNIISTLPAYGFVPVGWTMLDGTSMAAPHVAGVAALLASEDPALRVTAGVPALRSQILATGKPLPLTVGDTVTGRMVDARNALDDVAPVAAAPNSHAFVSGVGLGQTTVSTTVSWPAASDDISGIGSYELQQRVNGGAWTTVVGATAARTATRTLSVDATYQFRVRARDRAGNTSGYAEGPSILPKLYSESTSLATYSGTWSTAANAYASGGRTRFASKANASVSFRFNGRAVAIVAPKGTTRGSAKVYVDGALISTISLYRSSTTNRIVVFTRSWTSYGSHTVKLVVVGTSGRPRVDVDAFAVLR